jgi:hypothetical protein
VKGRASLIGLIVWVASAIGLTIVITHATGSLDGVVVLSLPVAFFSLVPVSVSIRPTTTPYESNVGGRWDTICRWLEQVLYSSSRHRRPNYDQLGLLERGANRRTTTDGETLVATELIQSRSGRRRSRDGRVLQA